MKALIALLLLSATVLARDYSADVVRVVDGDTVIVNVSLGFDLELRGQPVRLANANAPEKNTDAGKVSKGWLEVMLASKRVVISTDDKNERDKYGRILARIVVDGVDVGEKAKAEHFAHGGPGRKDP